jgi:hypothetical protein
VHGILKVALGWRCRFASGLSTAVARQDHASTQEEASTAENEVGSSDAEEDAASVVVRLCPYCDHDHTRRVVRASKSRQERWQCRCKNIETCKDCPKCSKAVIAAEDCVCPLRRGKCTCGKAKESQSNRICVQMECAYVDSQSLNLSFTLLNLQTVRVQVRGCCLLAGNGEERDDDP